MTVSYNLDVSRKSWTNAFKILFRWRGSIWKLVWKELVIWLCIYYAVMIIYRRVLSEDAQRTFELLAHFIESRINWIPLTFILAFFVSIVLGRWTRIIDNMGYIENAALTVATAVRGTELNDIIARRTLVRYMCLSQVLVFRDISMKVRRRFPNLESIVQAGFFEEEEKEMYEAVALDSNKYWVPLSWACALLCRLREAGNLASDTPMNNIVTEIKNIRNCLQTLCNFDWVVYFAVYIYFILALISRQFIIGSQAANKATLDISFPFVTALQFVFYVGWMKVAEVLMNPMGEDDDHFECNVLIDKNISTALAIVDDSYDKVPPLKMDRFSTQRDPLYAEQAHSVCSPFTGSAAHLVLASKDELVHMVPVKSERAADEINDSESISSIPNAMKKRMRRLSEANFNTLARTRRASSLAAIYQFATRKHSDARDNVIHDAELGKSTKPPSYDQSFDSVSHIKLPGANHFHRAAHITKAPELDEIEEESNGSSSRKTSENAEISSEAKKISQDYQFVSTDNPNYKSNFHKKDEKDVNGPVNDGSVKKRHKSDKTLETTETKIVENDNTPVIAAAADDSAEAQSDDTSTC